MVLEEVVAQVPAGRRLAQRRLGVEVIALRGGEALVAFQRIGAGGKALGGEPGGAQAVLRGGAGMQWLAHGAEVGLQAGRLGGGDAEGDGELLVAQAQHAAGRGGGREGADRAGDVEALLIVAGRHQAADPARGLVAGDEALDEQLARRLDLLAERQQGGDDRDRRMAAHGEIDVVVVERMAGRAVDQGGGGRQDLLAAADQGRRTLGAVLDRFADQDVGQVLLRAGNGDGEPVEQALLGALDQVVGEIAPGESGGAAGDFGGDGNGGHGGSLVRVREVSDTRRHVV